MYDFAKIREGYDLKVEDIVNELSKLPQEAKFSICGDTHVVFHVEEDDSAVNLDTEYLEDSYDNFESEEDIPTICPITFDSDTEDDEEGDE